MKRQLSARLRIVLAVALTVLVSGALYDRVGREVVNLVNSFRGRDLSCGFFPGTPYDCGPPWSLGVELRTIGQLVFVGAGLFAMAWLLAGWVLRPVGRLAETVRQMGPDSPGRRIHPQGRDDEFARLARDLDALMDRVAAAYEGQRRFASNASHELRTPLAVQRTLIEVAMDAPAAQADLHALGRNLLATNERNERLIEGLLVLAESDRGLAGSVPVAFGELVGSVLDLYDASASTAGVVVHRALVDRLLPGDPVLLERMVTNLLQNAVKYNEPGGWVDVTMPVGSAGGALSEVPVLVVGNSGPLVPPEAVPALFEPFRRLSTDRTDHRGGAGLGLSIVRSIVTAHHGTVRAAPGGSGGLVVEVFLPG